MDNKFIQKSLDNTSSKPKKSPRSPDTTEEKFWLMESESVQLLLGSQGIDIFYSNFTQTFEKNLKHKKAALMCEERAAII